MNRLGGRFIQMAWDEMEMRVLDSLTKSNGIHALASVDLFHEITGIAHCAAPTGSLGLREIHGPGTVPQ